MSDARIIMERMRGLIESMACASQMHVAAMSSFAMAVSIGKKELPRC